MVVTRYQLKEDYKISREHVTTKVHQEISNGTDYEVDVVMHEPEENEARISANNEFLPKGDNTPGKVELSSDIETCAALEIGQQYTIIAEIAKKITDLCNTSPIDNQKKVQIQNCIQELIDLTKEEQECVNQKPPTQVIGTIHYGHLGNVNKKQLEHELKGIMGLTKLNSAPEECDSLKKNGFFVYLCSSDRAQVFLRKNEHEINFFKSIGYENEIYIPVRIGCPSSKTSCIRIKGHYEIWWDPDEQTMYQNCNIPHIHQMKELLKEEE